MKINGTKLKSIAESASLAPEQLAESLVPAGLGAGEALSALRNWMAERNHPRARTPHIAALAQALGVKPADFCRYVSTTRFVRGSDRKVGLVTEMIRGMPVDRAMAALQFNPKRAAVSVRKTLMAAVADAEQAQADIAALVVAESRVDGGPLIKRFKAKDRGRAHQILKRTSHIVVGVEEKN